MPPKHGGISWCCPVRTAPISSEEHSANKGANPRTLTVLIAAARQNKPEFCADHCTKKPAAIAAGSNMNLGLLAALYAAPVAAQGGATIQVANSEEYGEYLTDGNGRAFYLFTTDKPAGADAAEISCTSEECLEAYAAWVAFASVLNGSLYLLN